MKKYTLTAKTTEHLAAQIAKHQNTLNKYQFRDFKPKSLRLIEVKFVESNQQLTLTFQDDLGPFVPGSHLFAVSDFGVLFPNAELIEVGEESKKKRSEPAATPAP